MDVRVLVVDDNDFVRTMVAGILQQADGITVVGECRDGVEVCLAAAAVRPDVVLMDVHMSVMSGIAATWELARRQPTVRVLILTGHPDARGRDQAARAGAVGYLIKGGDGQDVVQAVRVVGAGGTAWAVTGSRADQDATLVTASGVD